MGAMQLRHFKLWYAGDVRNWGLARYELQQINVSFQEAVKYYPNFPLADMESMGSFRGGDQQRDRREGRRQVREGHRAADRGLQCMS
jgi:hypothetical protein